MKNLKKILALVAAMSLMACSFASCGSDDNDDDSSSKKSSSSDKDDDDEDEDEDDDDSKKSKKDKDEDEEDADDKSKDDEDEDDADDKSKDDEDEDDEDDKSKDDEDEDDSKKKNDDDDTAVSLSDGDIDKDLLGSWYGDSTGVGMGFLFRDDANIDLFMDMSSQIYFEGEKLYFAGTETPDDAITFDGKSLSVNVSGTEIMTLDKIEDIDGSDYYGEYELKSGMLMDSIPETGSDEGIHIIFDDGISVCSYLGVMQYSAKDGKMTLIDHSGMLTGSEGETEEATYEISGDTLSLTAEGETLEMSRWDFK